MQTLPSEKEWMMEEIKLSIAGGKVIADLCDGSALKVMSPKRARETAGRLLELADAALSRGREIFGMDLEAPTQARTVALEIIKMASVAERNG